MHPLTILVPPQFEAAVGYHGDARYVAIHWTPCGDEAVYDDGRISGTGHWTGYLAWVRHPAVALELAPFHLGSSDSEATHWLVIDRRTRKAFVAPSQEARRVLHNQWPAVVPAVISQEEWEALFGRLEEEFSSKPMPTMEEIEAHIREQRRVEEEMVRWLDAMPEAQAAREAIRRLVNGDGQRGPE